MKMFPPFLLTFILKQTFAEEMYR